MLVPWGRPLLCLFVRSKCSLASESRWRMSPCAAPQPLQQCIDCANSLTLRVEAICRKSRLLFEDWSINCCTLYIFQNYCTTFWHSAQLNTLVQDLNMIELSTRTQAPQELDSRLCSTTEGWGCTCTWLQIMAVADTIGHPNFVVGQRRWLRPAQIAGKSSRDVGGPSNVRSKPSTRTWKYQICSNVWSKCLAKCRLFSWVCHYVDERFGKVLHGLRYLPARTCAFATFAEAFLIVWMFLKSLERWFEYVWIIDFVTIFAAWDTAMEVAGSVGARNSLYGLQVQKNQSLGFKRTKYDSGILKSSLDGQKPAQADFF